MPSTTKDSVLARLRAEKVKLWLPPYRLPARGGGANQEALAKLAGSLREKIVAAKDDDGASPTQEEICDVLLELQTHAVQKLREKNSVAVKVLATERHLAALPKGEDGNNIANSAFPAWGEEVTASGASGNAKALRVQIAGVSPTLTVGKFANDLCRVLDAKSVRVIWKGRKLLANGEGDCLQKIVCGKSQSTEKKKGELFCIVSGFGYVPPEAAVASQPTSAPEQPTESDIIASIRQAAQTLQDSNGGSRFEITDQSGNLVPMQQSDTVAFLTALGLHRIGRSRMEKRDVYSAVAGDDANGSENKRDGVASTLAFLLEADAEWNNSPALGGWRERCDNYGLLQLDIAWCFLRLESLENLSDAVHRLAIAEKVLMKQVHANFCTLALAQAEMDHAIPPLCSIFVRLFLLQGVANKMQSCNTTAAERLGWARLLCNRLRSTSPEESVTNLSNAYLVDPSTAIAALRRSNGDPDAAGNCITQSREEEKAAAKKRRRQHRMGQCANGTDFVNLDLAPTLSNLLGYGDVLANISSHDDGRGPAIEDLSTSAMIVIGLLRLSDNDIDRALEMYNELGAEQVFDRVARLDEASGRNRKQKSKKRERERQTEHEVRDMDLTMLVSMGVDEERGRDALRATGNVESAILWLSRDETVEGGAATGADEMKLGSNASEGNAGGNA
ncbi:hypothetical protein ACHAXT_009045 [Thalassiosira profunda]